MLSVSKGSYTQGGLKASPVRQCGLYANPTATAVKHEHLENIYACFGKNTLSIYKQYICLRESFKANLKENVFQCNDFQERRFSIFFVTCKLQLLRTDFDRPIFGRVPQQRFHLNLKKISSKEVLKYFFLKLFILQPFFN